jgi:hypothetical protein
MAFSNERYNALIEAIRPIQYPSLLSTFRLSPEVNDY